MSEGRARSATEPLAGGSISGAVDIERRRIVGELHDRIGPNLAAVGIHLRMIERHFPSTPGDELSRLLGESQALLSETISEIRDLSEELRPARLEYSGLLAALQDQIERFRRRTGLEVQMNVQLSHTGEVPAGLAAEQQWLVYRVIQEALNNCSKHAAPCRVTIDLGHEGGFLALQIRDDGVGFDPAEIARSKHAPGLGLLTMRERVEQANGRFDLYSQRGRGTHIRVELPCSPVP